MAEIHQVFTRALQRLWGPDYWVAWPPNVSLAPGDVGVVRQGRFTATGRLADRDIDVETPRSGVRSELTYDSDGAVSVTFKAAGASPDGFQAIAVAEAGAQVRFRREHAVLAVYADLRETRLRSLRDVAEQLVRRFWDGGWSEDEAVVTHVVRARSASILVGTSKESQAELRAEASAATPFASLASLAANVSIAHRDQLGFAYTGRDMTPFFRLLRLRSSWTGRVRPHYGRGAAEAPRRMPAGVIQEALADPESVVELIEQLPEADGAGR